MMNEFNPDGKDIRFIDSHYRDLFRIPDGGTIQVHYSDDSVVIKPCKFIDEYSRIELHDGALYCYAIPSVRHTSKEKSDPF